MALEYTRAVRSVLAVCVLVSGAGACLSTPPNPGALDAAVDAPVDAEVDAEIDAPIDAPVCADGDGDGWTVNCPGTPPDQIDCNDMVTAVHPGAHESAGIDHDCVTGAPDVSTAYPDMTVAVFGTTGREIGTRTGTWRMHPSAGHQLGSISVERMTGGPSEELIYTGPLLEKFSGVHIWDDYLAVQPDSSALGDLDTAHRGPVVFQAQVTWSDGTGPAASGFSKYTFTIDGRIIRTDQLELFSQPPNTGVDFPGITSHVALAARGATTGDTLFHTLVVRDSVQGVLTAPLPESGPGGGFGTLGTPFNWRWSCALGNEVEVGFAPYIPDFDNQPTRAMRATSNLSTNPVYRQIALQYDWQQGMGGPPATLILGDQRGHFLIGPRGREGDNCAYFDQQARAFLSPPTFTFGDPSTGQLLTSDPDDENDDGYVEGGGYWIMQANTEAGITFQMSVPGGTTPPPRPLFRIRGLPRGIDPLVYINGERVTQGVHYRVQDDLDAGIWLSIMAGLPADHEVQVVYPTPVP